MNQKTLSCIATVLLIVTVNLACGGMGDDNNRDGYNRDGNNRDGYNRDRNNRNGNNRDGYNRDGNNRDGNNRDGNNRDGNNRDGYNRDGNNRDGNNRDGYNRDGNNRDGNNRDGYNRDGNNRDGNDNNRSSNDGYNDGGMDGYYDDDTKVIGTGGIDPRKKGVDVGDHGPVTVKGGRPMSQSLNLWISEADNWDRKGSGRYGGKQPRYGKDRQNDRNDDYKGDDYKGNDYKGDDYKGNDYKGDDYKGNDYKDNDYKGNDYKGNDYKDNDYKGGQRNKRSYKKYNFPIKQYKNYKKFPFSLFPPLISIAPWVPIFYDKLTYQTFIFSIQGGIIIIPPVINFIGQRFAVAQLIKWGYASLVSSGAPPPPGVNVAPLIQPGVAPVPVGPKGGPPPAAPNYDSKAHKFDRAYPVDAPSFRPRNNYLQEGYNNAAAAPPANGPKPSG